MMKNVAIFLLLAIIAGGVWFYLKNRIAKTARPFSETELRLGMQMFLKDYQPRKLWWKFPALGITTGIGCGKPRPINGTAPNMSTTHLFRQKSRPNSLRKS